MKQPQTAAPDRSGALLSLAMKAAPLVVVGATAAALGAAPAPDATTSPVIEQTQKYDEAMAALEARRYSAAYGRFAALADEGHAASALMALAMVTYPPTLVDPEWGVTPAQLRRWTDLAMNDVRVRARVVAQNDRTE